MHRFRASIRGSHVCPTRGSTIPWQVTHRGFGPVTTTTTIGYASSQYKLKEIKYEAKIKLKINLAYNPKGKDLYSNQQNNTCIKASDRYSCMYKMRQINWDCDYKKLHSIWIIFLIEAFVKKSFGTRLTMIVRCDTKTFVRINSAK